MPHYWKSHVAAQIDLNLSQQSMRCRFNVCSNLLVLVAILFSLVEPLESLTRTQGPVAQSVVSPNADPAVVSSIRDRFYTLVVIHVDHEIVFTVFPFLLEELLPDTSESMYTKTWLTA